MTFIGPLQTLSCLPGLECSCCLKCGTLTEESPVTVRDTRWHLQVKELIIQAEFLPASLSRCAPIQRNTHTHMPDWFRDHPLPSWRREWNHINESMQVSHRCMTVSKEKLINKRKDSTCGWYMQLTTGSPNDTVYCRSLWHMCTQCDKYTHIPWGCKLIRVTWSPSLRFQQPNSICVCVVVLWSLQHVYWCHWLPLGRQRSHSTCDTCSKHTPTHTSFLL